MDKGLKGLPRCWCGKRVTEVTSREPGGMCTVLAMYCSRHGDGWRSRTFRIGDVVTLKSGGPNLVVYRVFAPEKKPGPPACEAQECKTQAGVNCGWFTDTGEYRSALFACAILENFTRSTEEDEVQSAWERAERERNRQFGGGSVVAHPTEGAD